MRKNALSAAFYVSGTIHFDNAIIFLTNPMSTPHLFRQRFGVSTYQSREAACQPLALFILQSMQEKVRGQVGLSTTQKPPHPFGTNYSYQKGGAVFSLFVSFACHSQIGVASIYYSSRLSSLRATGSHAPCRPNQKPSRRQAPALPPSP